MENAPGNGWNSESTFESIWEAHHQDVFRYVRSYLGYPRYADAEDITSGVFTKLLQHPDVAHDRVKAWLFRTATNDSVSYFRNATRQRTLLAGDVSGNNGETESAVFEPAAQIPHDISSFQMSAEEYLLDPSALEERRSRQLEDMKNALDAAIGELSPWTRQIRDLYETGLNPDEIARVLGTTAKKVKKNYYAGNRRIKREANKKFKAATM